MTHKKPIQEPTGKTKHRAKIEILNYISRECITKDFGAGSLISRKEGYFTNTDHPKVGDLVSLQFAPKTKFYLSWYIKYDVPDIHTLESIEDNNILIWGNVSFFVLNRNTVRTHPEWRWTDKQFYLNDQWVKVCNKINNPYSYYPLMLEFKEDNSVKLSMERRWVREEDIKSAVFKNSKKILLRDMIKIYEGLTR